MSQAETRTIEVSVDDDFYQLFNDRVDEVTNNVVDETNGEIDLTGLTPVVEITVSDSYRPGSTDTYYEYEGKIAFRDLCGDGELVVYDISPVDLVELFDDVEALTNEE